MPDSKITVMCVEDHSVVREGISLIINLQPDMRVVAAAATGEEGLELFRLHKPDVTLMDLQLPGMSGLETIRAIRQESSDARIIVLTMYEGDEDIFRALEAGAVSYLLKDARSEEVVRTVRGVRTGERPIAPEIAARLAERTTLRQLSHREHEVLELIAKGMRNKEIASALGISEETAHVHTKNLFAKLKVKDRTSAVTVALRRGLIRLG
jgi:two-component system NarL family response regulator